MEHKINKYITHLGSTLAIIFGIIISLSSILKISNGSMTESGWVGGISLILGALAYRSAKKRRLNQVKNTLLRRSLECSSCLLILLIVFCQNGAIELMNTDPVPNLIIPFISIFVFLFEFIRTHKLSGK